MKNENKTISGISFDFFGTFVTVNEVRITVRVPEENDRLLGCSMTFEVEAANGVFRVRRGSTRWLSTGWDRGFRQKHAAKKQTGGRS